MTAAPKPGRHLATQTLHPWRTSIRTGISTGLFFLAAIAAAAPIAAPFAEQYIPDSATRIVAFGVFCGGLAFTIKRIGSIPAVARLFVLLGIGVVPRSDLIDPEQDSVTSNSVVVSDTPGPVDDRLQFQFPNN